MIQRFEFTFELAWKTLNVFLEKEGIECRTPKDCLRAAFRVGHFRNQEEFLDMLEDRNKTARLYDKEESEKVFQAIKLRYFPALKQPLVRSGSWNENV